MLDLAIAFFSSKTLVAVQDFDAPLLFLLVFLESVFKELHS
jgi:hypothetical protein